jgi:hypothetical protein
VGATGEDGWSRRDRGSGVTGESGSTGESGVTGESNGVGRDRRNMRIRRDRAGESSGAYQGSA